MKLRYYMRGLGIGILVTAILMSVTINGKTEKLTDEEIIERAKELGMEEKYDSTRLSESVSQNETEKQEVAPEEVAPEQEEETKAQTPAESESVVEAETKAEADTEDALTVQITVQGGDGSMTISRKLKEAGLIEDVLAYDRFLCSKGYDRRICTGTHSFPVGASEEEIAQILMTKDR